MTGMVQSTIELVVHVTVPHREGTPAPDGFSAEVRVAHLDGISYSVDETAIVESSVITEGISLD